MTRREQGSDAGWRVWTALVLVQVFFGTHYVAAKVVLGRVPAPAWAAIRVLCAALLLEAWVLARRGEVPRRIRDWGLIAGFALCGVVVNQVLFVEGLSRTTPAHSSLINTAIPIWTLLFAWLLGREPLTRRKVAGLALAVAGVWILQADGLRLGERLYLGDLLTLLNSISYGLFLVVSKRYLSKHDPLSTTAHVFAVGCVGTTLYGAASLVRLDFGGVPPGTWLWAAYIVVFPTIGAYALNYYALRRVHSSVVALFIYLQPLIATALGAALLGSVPGWPFFLAGALVFAGVGIVAGARRRPPLAAPYSPRYPSAAEEEPPR